MSSTDAVDPIATLPVFPFLPAYAKFLLDNHLPEFAATLLHISRSLRIPLLRYFETMPEPQLIALGIETNRLLLEAMINNSVVQYIDENLRSWKENQLPLIQGDDIVIEDISKVNFARRKVFRDFLPRYTQDVMTYVGVMEDVDLFTLLQEEQSYKTLFEMKERKIREHHHFISKINNASPGFLYVYELATRKQIYANHKRAELLGYSEAEVAALEPEMMDKLIHSEDRATLQEHFGNFYNAGDVELRTVEFRILDKQGNYIWQRAYETVFKRDDGNVPVEIIGMAIDISQEKEASIKLEMREQQLQEAQEIGGMGSFEWDLLGNESSFSPLLLNIFELDEKTNLPEFLDHVHPADKESVTQAIAISLTGDHPFECEYRYSRNGPEKVIWSRGKVQFKNGKPFKMKGTVMDITQRHNMLKRLARSEDLHKQAQALTKLGNWSWSLINNTVEWSDEMYRIFGLHPQSEQMTLDRILTFVHPDDREARRSALRDATETLNTEDYTMRVLAPDGAIKYVEGKTEVLCDEGGSPYKIAGTCQDITANFLLNERLKENQEASNQLVNSAPEAIVVIDEDSRILLWNPKASAIFGWHPDEILGKSLMTTIIPPTYRQAHSMGIERLKTTGKSKVLNRTIEVEAQKKNGQIIFISLNISRSVRAGSTVFIAFIRDISEEKGKELELEAQRSRLAEQNLALERSNEELTAFNYIASHDLKEPVRKVKMFGNIIAAQARGLSIPLQAAVARILAAADHMERLIEALIIFSRTNTGERLFEKLNITSVITNVQLQLKERIEESGAVIEYNELPEVSAIPFQMEQLFENLISNSLKYARSGVPPLITITATKVSGHQIGEPTANPSALYHRISVTDNGIGFDQQYASKIFEVFQRLHSKETYTGTGIGLAICKKIVQQHNGFITARSVPGEGSTFDVYLSADLAAKDG